MRQPVIPPVLVSCREAWTALGIGKTKFFELVRREEIETVLIDGRRLVPVDAINDFAQRRRSTPNPAA